MKLKRDNLKVTTLSNVDVKNIANLDTLYKNFFLFNKNNLDIDSKWIFVYHDEFCVDNIIGFMELNRYPIIGGVTIMDKTSIPFDIFENESFVDYIYKNEVNEISKLDTFVLINNVEVLKQNRLQGVGSLMYSYLENSILTEEDSLIEITRTIQGKNCNLLGKIDKVPTFTNLENLFNSL